MKILNARWFTEMGSLRPIGIVLGQDEITGECKSYIGTGNGFSEEADADQIVRRGAKFIIERGDSGKQPSGLELVEKCSICTNGKVWNMPEYKEQDCPIPGCRKGEIVRDLTLTEVVELPRMLMNGDAKLVRTHPINLKFCLILPFGERVRVKEK